MTIEHIITLIQAYSDEQKLQTLHYVQVIEALYKQYGDRLLSEDILSLISKEDQELALLISALNKSIGVQKLSTLQSMLASIIDSVDIQTSHGDSDELKKMFLDTHIQFTPLDELGIKITSHDGKMYERFLEKDIEKLSRS